MKKIIQGTLSVLCIFAVTLLMLAGVSNMVERKDSVAKHAEFFEHPETTDVMFFGSSHMLNAVFPTELWEDFGISSYSFAGHGSRIPTNYWIMRNAFDYTVPKAVVVDCYFLSKDEMRDAPEEFLHLSLDAFPLTKTKIQAVYDLLGEEEDRAAFLFPFSTYHNRWKELSENDFNWESSPETGGSIRGNFTSLDRYAKVELDEVTPYDGLGVKYLRKLIEYCQEQDVEVMLTYVPFAADEWSQKEDRVTELIAQEYGVSYVGLEELSNQINFASDFADAGHLNYSGGAKITKYLGQKLRSELNIPDRTDDPDCDFWVEISHRYTELKREMAETETAVARFMPLLADNILTNVVLYNGQWEHGDVEAVLKDWGVSQELLDENETFIAVIDNQRGTCDIIAQGNKLETAFGEIALDRNGDVYKALIGGKAQYTMNLQDDKPLWICTLDTSTMNVVFESCFNTKGYRSVLE